MAIVFVCLQATLISGLISSLNRNYLKVYQWLDLGTNVHTTPPPQHTHCIVTEICGPTGAKAEEILESTDSVTTYAGIEKICNK